MAAHSAGLPFAIAHVNYGLREDESDQEEAFVQQVGSRLGVEVYISRISPEAWTSEGNIQDQARQLRYAFFEELMSHHGFDCCLLAHQQDDQSETILMSLLRGNQFRVLSPMPDARPGYLRPFLSLPRELCRTALTRWEQPWKEDSSNAKNAYTRNQVRNDVFPLLRQVNPSVSAQLSDRAAVYQQQRDLLKALLSPHLNTCIRITPYVKTFDWSGLPDSLRDSHLRMILASVLDDWGWHGYDLWAGAELSQASPGKLHQFQGELIRGREMVQWIQIPDKESDDIRIQAVEELASDYHLFRSVDVSLSVVPQSLHTAATEHYLDLRQIQWPVTLRKVKTGDKFSPLGMNGQKLVSDMMIDAKFRPAQKRLALILEDQEGPIWLSDYRIADRVKITEESQQVIRLVTEPAD